MTEKPACYISPKHLEVYNERKAGKTFQQIANERGLSRGYVSQMYHSVEHKREFVKRVGELSKLTTRTYDTLARAGIRTMEQLAETLDSGKLSQLRNMGRKGIEEVERLIHGH